jgi:hypothetical protein
VPGRTSMTDDGFRTFVELVAAFAVVTAQQGE